MNTRLIFALLLSAFAAGFHHPAFGQSFMSGPDTWHFQQSGNVKFPFPPSRNNTLTVYSPVLQSEKLFITFTGDWINLTDRASDAAGIRYVRVVNKGTVKHNRQDVPFATMEFNISAGTLGPRP